MDIYKYVDFFQEKQHFPFLCLLLSRFGPQRPSRLKYQVNNDPKHNPSSSLTYFNCCSPLPFFILLQLCYHFSWLLIKNRFSPCRRLLDYDRISDGAHINGSGVSYRAECRPHKDDWPCYSQPLRVVGEQLWADEHALTRASLIEVYACKNKCKEILNNNPKSYNEQSDASSCNYDIKMYSY